MGACLWSESQSCPVSHHPSFQKSPVTAEPMKMTYMTSKTPERPSGDCLSASDDLYETRIIHDTVAGEEM